MAYRLQLQPAAHLVSSRDGMGRSATTGSTVMLCCCRLHTGMGVPFLWSQPVQLVVMVAAVGMHVGKYT